MESKVTQTIWHYDMLCLSILAASPIDAPRGLGATAALAPGGRQGPKTMATLSARRLPSLLSSDQAVRPAL
jgi:hypothetical protein